jgi:signal transduction histidine kinase/CheY-like chemotaxis protein
MTEASSAGAPREVPIQAHLAPGLGAEVLVGTLDHLLEGCQIISPDFRYLYVNEAAAQHGRMSIEALVGHKMQEVYPGIDTTPMWSTLCGVMANGGATQFENQFAFADGSVRWFELRVVRVPIGVCILSVDITERVAMTRLASRSQRLESLGTLASGVAHDLNNALAPLVLSVGMLRDDGKVDEEIIATLEEGAQRAVRLVRQLITFAKGADGQRLPVRPKDLVAEMERLIRSTFPRDITLRVRAEDSLPMVMGDATQLHQVLLNLCVNARDAMVGGGALTIEADVMQVDATYAASVLDGRPGAFVTFAVRDTGTGIANEVIDRIFDPFFTTKGELGTGLGLSMSLGIVRGHGGFVHVYSEPSLGTTFRVFIPIAAATPEIIGVREVHGLEGKNRTVLVIDDDARVRQAASTVLGQLGFHVVTAMDGADALAQVGAHLGELHLVLLDLHMPRMSGVSFLEKLREILPTVPVIVASGHLHEDHNMPDELRGLPQIAKPFTQEDLVWALKQALER